MGPTEPKLDHSRRVAIGGETFSVRSDAPPETIDKVAHYVDERISQARAALGETDRFRIAVLASLQVAGDLMEAKQELETSREELRLVREKISALSERLAED